MIRSGFKRTAIERVRTVHVPVPVENRRKASMTPVAGAEVQAQPKREYVRSKALMAAYRAIPCQHCGTDDGTVCGAHANTLKAHKGRGIKADDNLCASLCFTCHGALDQGHRMTREERETMHANAHVKTVRELLKRGLWPMNCPIPDIRRMN